MEKKSSRFLFLISSHTLWKTIVGKIKKVWTKPVAKTAADINYLQKYNMNYKFDCEHPVTYNEKICWLKVYYRNDLWKKCADKLGSKEFLKEQGLEQYIVKTLGIYKDSSEINLNELPDKFVLKANHDSGSVFICEKGKTNFDEVFAKLDKAIKNTYADNWLEWVYEDIKPVIFAEELLEPIEGVNELADYKLNFFNGKFGCGYVAQNRSVDVRFWVFEGNFKIQKVKYIHPNPKQPAPYPPHYDEMISIGSKLSKILDFVRVDYYETSQGLRIGELTFLPGSGNGVFSKKKYDYKYGKCFDNCELSKLFPKRVKTK